MSDENLEEKNLIPKNEKGEGSFKPVVIIMIISLIIAFFWNKISFLKDAVHSVLDPSAGALLNWNLNLGMTLLVLIIALVTTLVQKYTTDQETLKELRKEQKEIQKKMKELKHDPEKMMQMQKETMPLTLKQMKLSMRSVIFTGIPFLLFFRWFYDFFAIIGDPKIFGFFTWFWFYLIFAMVFGGILRKVFDVV